MITIAGSINVRYLTPVCLGSMSFNVGPLWINLINALFNHTRSKHNLTLPDVVTKKKTVASL